MKKGNTTWLNIVGTAFLLFPSVLVQSDPITFIVAILSEMIALGLLAWSLKINKSKITFGLLSLCVIAVILIMFEAGRIYSQQDFARYRR